jgi:hypothetical protein
VALLAFLAWPSASPGFELEDDQLDVEIHISARWKLDELDAQRRAEGTASATITGTVERQPGFPFGREKSFKYEGNLTATYSWNARYWWTGEGACTDCCPAGTLAREHGAGTVPVDHFRLQVYLGEVGNRVARREGCTRPVEGVYWFSTDFSFDSGIEQVHSSGSCYPADWPWARDTVARGFDLGAHKVLDATGLQGSFVWTSRERTLELLDRDIDLAIWDHCGRTVLQYDHQVPEDPRGNIHLQVNWRIGKVKPMVKVWRVSDQPRDITDALLKEVPAIVGRKLRLEARVLPPGADSGPGRWTIEGRPIADYEADEEHGRVAKLKESDYRRKEIEFLWADAAPGGIPRRVTYEVDTPQGRVHGETLITVYEPRARLETSAAEGSTIGPTPEGCELCYGRVGRDASGQWGAEPPGVHFDAQVAMPRPFAAQPHSLAWVQRIKESRRAREAHYRSGEKYFTFQESSNDPWCLDGRFPYAGRYGGELQDTPGNELGRFTDEVHAADAYQSDLLFAPCAEPEDDRCAWVPLKRVEWDWQAGARRRVDVSYTEDQPCSEETFDLCYGPPATPSVQDLDSHPKWDCNADDNRWRDIGEAEWRQGTGSCREATLESQP